MNWQKTFQYLTHQIYIEPELLKLHTPTLLHLSDTPRAIYPALRRLIVKLQPTYIIHTGDLADHIKLGLLPGSINRYARDVIELMEILDHSSAQSIFIALGNHDDADTLHQLSPRAKIFEASGTVQLENKTICLSHYGKALLESTAEFNLFGHDLALSTGLREGRQFLNGLSAIHLIELRSSTVHVLHYPWGTDDARTGKVKVRL